MPIRKQDAQRALKLLENYRAKLAKTEDRQLRASIERVINIFRSNLFQALIDIQEFYEVSLLDNQPVPQKNSGIVPAVHNWDISSLPSTIITSESPPISLSPNAEGHSLLNEILDVLQTSVPTQVIHVTMEDRAGSDM